MVKKLMELVFVCVQPITNEKTLVIITIFPVYWKKHR